MLYGCGVAVLRCCHAIAKFGGQVLRTAGPLIGLFLFLLRRESASPVRGRVDSLTRGGQSLAREAPRAQAATVRHNLWWTSMVANRPATRRAQL